MKWSEPVNINRIVSGSVIKSPDDRVYIFLGANRAIRLKENSWQFFTEKLDSMDYSVLDFEYSMDTRGLLANKFGNLNFNSIVGIVRDLVYSIEDK